MRDLTGLHCTLHVDQSSRLDVVYTARDRYRLWRRWGIASTRNVVDIHLSRIGKGKPFRKLSGPRTQTFRHIVESIGAKLTCSETAGEQYSNYLVDKELHPPIGGMDNEKLESAKHLAADHRRSNRIVAGAAFGIVDDVRIPL